MRKLDIGILTSFIQLWTGRKAGHAARGYRGAAQALRRGRRLGGLSVKQLIEEGRR